MGTRAWLGGKLSNGFRVTLIVQARVISRPAMAATRGDAKQAERDSPTAMLHGPGNRCLQIRGWLHAREGFVPLLGTMPPSGIHLRRKAARPEPPTDPEMMKDIPINEAMIAWNPCRHPAFRKNGKPGQILVVRHPDNTNVADHLSDTTAPKWDLSRVDLKRETKAGLFLRLKLMVEAWHIACRDGVPIQNIHEAFLAIPEYRELLSSDFRASMPEVKTWGDLQTDFGADDIPLPPAPQG